jgi:hypothetical protein
MKQISFLGHHADIVSQRGQPNSAQVVSVQANPSAGRIIQAWQQVGNGGFTCATRANQGYLASLMYFQQGYFQ